MEPTENMTRYALAKEMAKYADPAWYQSVLGLPTPVLAALVAYYRHPVLY